MKQFLLIIIAVLLGVRSNAKDVLTLGGIKYFIQKGGYAFVNRIDKDLVVVSIPDSVDYKGVKYPVREIGEQVAIGPTIFGKTPNLRMISIPNTVTKIWDCAFQNCKNLTDIILPDDPVDYIGILAFENCKLIKSVKCHNGSVPTYINAHLEPSCPYLVSYNSKDFQGNNQNVLSDNNSIAEGLTSSTKAQPQAMIHSGAQLSDVDINIPTSSFVNRTTFAIIIANEEYQKESKVDYALNDGKMFKTYCHQVLGLPEKNIHLISNATLNNIIYELDWLSQVCKVYEGDASVIFYYAGHGIPNEKDGSAYLLPIDGIGRNMRTCMSTEELYKMLGTMPAKSVTVFMDACFSGAKRNGEMLTSARGVAIKAKSESPVGKNMVILSAAQGDETAYSYNEQQHGLFTYYLLKKLKSTGGQVSLGELSDYIKSQVTRFSIVENGKIQTPTVNASPALGDRWKQIKLR